eukprot:TRINITY_DN1744_c0_g1_i1.p1 TRINITY_DN1744_c0_g1~~TRINITY_DN1744_c0_g1_i1.p1  ORF type:complete len:424 (+),score=136.04 TRINITY_DN1744_c0_g1_i1:100-1371(+)
MMGIISFLVCTFLFLIYEFLLHILFFIVKNVYTLNKSFNRFVTTHPDKKRLIVLGGGYAGTLIAMKLENEFEVTLIDDKEYFEFTPSKLRALVFPSQTRRMRSNYSDFLPRSIIIKERISSVSEGCVRAGGREFPFDYLVVSTGSRYSDPQSIPISSASGSNSEGIESKSPLISTREKDIHLQHSSLKGSEGVLIIGGGTVGVELAGEIAHFFPTKKITLVHSESHLIQRSPPRAINYTHKFMKNNGIELILNDRVVSRDENGSFYTKSGVQIRSQLAFLATGNLPNSEFLRGGHYSSALDSKGFVKVNQHLQIPGTINVFVAGDVASIQEEKLCQTAGDHAQLIASNIRALEKGKKLQSYHPKPCPMLISLGKFDGILTYRGFSMTGFVPAAMKEFVEWKEMAQFYLPSWLISKKKSYSMEV